MRQHGISLMETIVVIGLLMLIIGMGSVFSFTYIQAQYLRASAHTIEAELRQAQNDSWTQADDTSHGVKVFTDRVVRFEGASYASRTVSADVETEFATPVTLSGTDEVVFLEGTVTPSSAATITLANDSKAIDITLTAYGVLTLTERAIGS